MKGHEVCEGNRDQEAESLQIVRADNHLPHICPTPP